MFIPFLQTTEEALHFRLELCEVEFDSVISIQATYIYRLFFPNLYKLTQFTEEKELRLQEIMKTMAINAYASAAITREDEMKSGQKLPTYDFSKLTQQETN